MLLSCKQLHLLGQNRMETCCHNIHTWYKKQTKTTNETKNKSVTLSMILGLTFDNLQLSKMEPPQRSYFKDSHITKLRSKYYIVSMLVQT